MGAFTHCDTIHSKVDKPIMGVKIKVQVTQNLMTSMIPTWKVLNIVATYLFFIHVIYWAIFCFIWLFLAVLYLLFGRSGSRGRSILLIGLSDSGKTLLFSRVSWSSCFIFFYFVNRPKSTTQAYLSEMLLLNLLVIFSVCH